MMMASYGVRSKTFKAKWAAYDLIRGEVEGGRRWKKYEKLIFIFCWHGNGTNMKEIIALAVSSTV